MTIGENLIKHLSELKTLLTSESEAEALNKLLDDPEEGYESEDYSDFNDSLEQLKSILTSIPKSTQEIGVNFLNTVEELFFDEDFLISLMAKFRT